MNEKIANEIEGMARHLFRLLDPSLSDSAQAFVIRRICSATVGALMNTFGLSDSEREALAGRLCDAVDDVLLSSESQVH